MLVTLISGVFGGTSWKTWAGIGAVAAVSLTVYLGYRHYEGLVARLEATEQRAATLDLAVKTQNETIGAQASAIAEWKGALAEYAKKLDEVQQYADEAGVETRRLRDEFAKVSLRALASKEPGLVTRRVNDGSDRARRMLECATATNSSACGSDTSGSATVPPTHTGPGANSHRAPSVVSATTRRDKR